MRKHAFTALLLAGVAATSIGASVALANRVDGDARSWAAGTASEVDEVANVLRAAIHARAVAARTFDVSGIVTNVVDDPTVPLSPKQREILARIDPTAAPTGQLSAELAFYAFWERGDAAFARVQQARQRGVAADPADLAAAMPRRSDPLYELPLTVHKVSIAGDRAYMEAETEAVYYRVTLVHRGSRWFIAGEDTTSRN